MKETDLRYVKTERAIRDAFFELLEESDFDKVSTETRFTCITAINSIWSILF